MMRNAKANMGRAELLLCPNLTVSEQAMLAEFWHVEARITLRSFLMQFGRRGSAALP
jgi:hypothetical protein